MRLSRVIRIVIAVGLTAVIVWKANPSLVFQAAAAADWNWIGGAALLVLVDRSLMAWRWIDLLCAVTPGSRPPFPVVLKIFFVSTFVGSFLPSIGGDAYRAYSLSRHDVRLSESAASVLMDRVLGVLAIALVGGAALAATLALTGTMAVGPSILIPLVAALAVCAAVGAAIFSDDAAAVAQETAAHLPWSAIRRATLSLTDAMRRYARHHRELMRVLAASVGVQVIRVVQAYCLGRALGIELPLGSYFLLIPIVLLVMLLPITVSGLGTSQLAFDYLFGHVGVASAQAVALSVLFVALNIVGNLPGSILYAVSADRGVRA